MVMLNQGKWRTATELVYKSNDGSKNTIIRFINRMYHKTLIKRRQLERIDLKKHQFVSSTEVFISENLMVKISIWLSIVDN